MDEEKSVSDEAPHKMTPVVRESTPRSGSQLLVDLFTPLEVPRVVKLSKEEYDQGSLSSFDMSSLTREPGDDEDADALNGRLGGGPLRNSAYHRARDLALTIALEEAVDNRKGDSYRRSLIFCVILFCSSFICLACVAGGSPNEQVAFGGSILDEVIDSEPYRWALFFSTGCCTPMFIHHCFQLIAVAVKKYRGRWNATFTVAENTGHDVVTTVACAMLNLTILIPNTGRITWFIAGRKFSQATALYSGIYGFQVCSFSSIIASLLTYHLPDSWEFKQLIVMCALLFNSGVVLYVFGQTFPDFQFRYAIYLACGLLSCSLLLFVYFLRKLYQLFFFLPASSAPDKTPRASSGKREEQRTGSLTSTSREKMSPKCVWVCLVSIASLLGFVVLTLADAIRLKSFRNRDFDQFGICYHVYVKTCFMLAISYLLPMRITEIFATQAKQSLKDFQRALLPTGQG